MYENRFKVGAVKITLDGSPQGRTAFFTTPYLTGGPDGEDNWKGEPTFPQDLANKMVKKVYDMNVPLILHCNGDASIDAFLTAYEFARAGDFSKPWNVTTIHTWRAHVCDMVDVNQAANREWTLVTLNGKKVTAQKPPTMKFSGGKLSMFGGINRLNASYALLHDTVTMGDILSTKMAGPTELMELESEYAKTMATVDSFHVHGDELELFSKEVVVATFLAQQ